jgi:Ca2+-transporting ATPase
MRVLAVAARGLEELPGEDTADDVECRLIYLGLEARDAVATCKTAGIRPGMITGDHPLTARAIAADLGMADPGSRGLTGRDLDVLDLGGLREAVREVDVFARVSPEHKLRIVEALQDEGEVVAILPDSTRSSECSSSGRPLLFSLICRSFRHRAARRDETCPTRKRNVCVR